MVNRFSTLIGEDFPYEEKKKRERLLIKEYSPWVIMLWKHATNNLPVLLGIYQICLTHSVA